MMKKIPIWKNVVLIVSVIIMLVIATLAWFNNGTKTTANDLVVRVGRATYLQVSGGNGTGDDWSNDLEVPIVGVSKNFKEISGNGSTLFAPKYVTEYENDILTTNIASFVNLSEMDKAEQSRYYYEEILSFRTDAKQDVYLTPETYIVPVGDARIDAALRLAFFELDENNNETLRFIWAPNSTVEYVDGSFLDEGEVETHYYYQKSINPGDVAQISTNGEVCGYDASSRFMWSNAVQIDGQEAKGQNLPQNAPPVFTWDEANEDGIYYKSVKVKVWLEGHDRECVSQLNGQMFTIKLKFTIAPEENDNE